MTDLEDLALLATHIEYGQVKALSIKQPWPHHIFHDGKDVENRDWPTRRRGWIMVHAGKKTDGKLPRALADAPLGGVVGIVRITDCVERMDSQWFFGRYGFVLRDARSLPLVPCRGQLGFFAPPAEVNASVGAALRAAIRLQQGSEKP